VSPRQSAEGPTFNTGVLNVDKAAGETSFSVVNRLRKLTGDAPLQGGEAAELTGLD